MTTPPPPPVPPQGPQNPYGQGGLVGPENDEAKTMGMIAHGGALFIGFIAPLLIMLLKKDSAFAQQESKEALNFQIIYSIAMPVSLILTFVLIGCILIPIVFILDLVFIIMAVVKNNNGEAYRYPINIRIIK